MPPQPVFIDKKCQYKPVNKTQKFITYVNKTPTNTYTQTHRQQQPTNTETQTHRQQPTDTDTETAADQHWHTDTPTTTADQHWHSVGRCCQCVGVSSASEITTLWHYTNIFIIIIIIIIIITPTAATNTDTDTSTAAEQTWHRHTDNSRPTLTHRHTNNNSRPTLTHRQQPIYTDMQTHRQQPTNTNTQTHRQQQPTNSDKETPTTTGGQQWLLYFCNICNVFYSNYVGLVLSSAGMHLIICVLWALFTFQSYFRLLSLASGGFAPDPHQHSIHGDHALYKRPVFRSP